MTSWLALLSGALLGFGLLVVGSAARSTPALRDRRPSDGFWLVRSAVAVTVAGVAALLTGWPVGTAAAAVGGWYGAGLLRWGRRSTRADLERMEAIATWAEQLRDGLAGQNGILGTIHDTAAVAPLPIRPEVEALALRLNRQRLDQALEQFALDMDDRTAELIAAVLLVAGTQASRDVGKLLSELAGTARERVAMRQRIDARRASIRTQQRGVVLVASAFMIGLTLLAREFVQPFSTLHGQVVLLMVVVLFALSLAWLSSLARFKEPHRLLTPEHLP